MFGTGKSSHFTVPNPPSEGFNSSVEFEKKKKEERSQFLDTFMQKFLEEFPLVLQHEESIESPIQQWSRIRFSYLQFLPHLNTLFLDYVNKFAVIIIMTFVWKLIIMKDYL